MAYVHIVTVLALLQFIVKAPAITGNEIFERHFRVQQNTLEQLVVFLPGLYLFSHFWNPMVAAALGVVYLVGREVYAVAYVKDPAKRSAGFGLSFLPTVILILGGLIGAVRTLF
jgi:glutathione S-transferase